MPVRSEVAASRSAHSRGVPTGCSPQSSSVYASGSRIGASRPSTVTWASSPCLSQPGIAFVSASTASGRRSAIWQTPAETWAAPRTSSGERPAARA